MVSLNSIGGSSNQRNNSITAAGGSRPGYINQRRLRQVSSVRMTEQDIDDLDKLSDDGLNHNERDSKR